MIALLIAACATGPAGAPVDDGPAPIGLAECAVCGMVVREQASPRGQLVYRDGHHSHLCSLEELRAAARAPSPRGRPVAAYVEALPAGFDWRAYDTAPLPWIAADGARFVFGAQRPRVMGVPVLSFADDVSAQQVADALGTVPVSWSDMLDTPVPAIPASASAATRGGAP